LNATPAPLFEGTAEIDLSILKETDQITFHAAPALEILKVVYQSKSSNSSSQPEVIKSIERDEKFERCTVTVGQKLPAGSEAKLGIVYKGVLEGSMMGYYRSTYEFKGKKGFYGLTQFEPTAARRAFPCWDEPAISQSVLLNEIGHFPGRSFLRGAGGRIDLLKLIAICRGDR
jgi:aminopeptidase 2